MRCRFEKNGIAFAVPFFIVSEISEWERESSARRGDGVFYAAFGSNNLRGFSRRGRGRTACGGGKFSAAGNRENRL